MLAPAQTVVSTLGCVAGSGTIRTRPDPFARRAAVDDCRVPVPPLRRVAPLFSSELAREWLSVRCGSLGSVIQDPLFHSAAGRCLVVHLEHPGTAGGDRIGGLHRARVGRSQRRRKGAVPAQTHRAQRAVCGQT